jgi:hypothetical protein
MITCPDNLTSGAVVAAGAVVAPGAVVAGAAVVAVFVLPHPEKIPISKTVINNNITDFNPKFFLILK